MSNNQSTPVTNKHNKKLSQKVIGPASALILLLVMVAWLAGFFNDKIAPEINQTSLVGESNDSYTVTRSKSAIFEGVSASITAKQATIISSRILARIDSISVRAGDNIKKGDVLISLEQNDLTSQVLKASEQVKAMTARHKEANQNYQRVKELYKKKLASEFTLDKSRADNQSIKADLTAAKQGLNQAETQLSYATLRAPINGKVVDRFAEPGDTAQAGTKLLSLYNPLSLRVEAQVREELALTLKHGQNISIELPTLNKSLTGLVEEIVPAANTGSRSFLIKINLSFQQQENLLPGMYARVLIPAGEAEKFYVPVNRVVNVGQLNFVWLDINGQAERRFVRLGKVNKSGLVAIISGVALGDKVLTPK